MAEVKKKRRPLLQSAIGVLQFPKLREADEYEGKRSYSCTLVVPEAEATPMIENILAEFEEVAPTLISSPEKVDKARRNISCYGPALDREKKVIPGFVAFKLRVPEFYTSKKAKLAGRTNDVTNLPLFFNKAGQLLATDSVPKFGFGTEVRINFDVFAFDGFGGGANLRPREVQLLKVVEFSRQAQGFGSMEDDEPSAPAGDAKDNGRHISHSSDDPIEF